MNVTSDGTPIVQFEFFADVVTESGYYDLACTSFALANQGDGAVTIDGKLTILPRQTFTLGMQSHAQVLAQRIRIAFAAGASVQRLEIIQQLPKDEKIAHYIRQHKK